MDLEAFRVRNYKRIEDTGWITCRDLTVLVGKNEAGKSAVLRGLSKLKPSDGEGYDGLREFPRHRFTDEFDSQDWPVASARFRLSGHDRAELPGDLSEATTVEVTRRYSGRYAVGFDPEPDGRPVSTKVAMNAVDESRRALEEALAPDGRGEDLRTLKEQIEAAL